jgi:hypothetical protein
MISGVMSNQPRHSDGTRQPEIEGKYSGETPVFVPARSEEETTVST